MKVNISIKGHLRKQTHTNTGNFYYTDNGEFKSGRTPPRAKTPDTKEDELGEYYLDQNGERQQGPAPRPQSPIVFSNFSSSAVVEDTYLIDLPAANPARDSLSTELTIPRLEKISFSSELGPDELFGEYDSDSTTSLTPTLSTLSTTPQRRITDDLQLSDHFTKKIKEFCNHESFQYSGEFIVTMLSREQSDQQFRFTVQSVTGYADFINAISKLGKIEMENGASRAPTFTLG